MKKATNKILSLVLVVMMLMGTFAMMFAYAEEPAEETITTPKAYNAVEDGEKLWDVDFSSEYFLDDLNDMKNDPDNGMVPYTNNGTVYLADGTPQDANKTGISPTTPYEYTPAAKAEDEANANVEGYVKKYKAPGLWSYQYGWEYGLWKKNLASTATVVEDNGTTLKIDGKIPANEETGTAEVAGDNTTTDSRYIGQIPTYDLENKTYTYDIEYFRNGIARSRIYFANGTFVNYGGCDPYMPCLGLELNASGYRLMRASAAVTTGVVGKPQYVTDETTKEMTTNIKIVLSGGEKIEDIALYNSNWTKETEHNLYWVGDVIPVEYSIYNTITKTKDDGTVTVMDIRCATGLIYQPADVALVLGIGEYNNVGNNQYYGIRNVDLYKGDASIPFNFNFTKVYSEANYGAELTLFDPKGITKDAYNYANGYEWVHQGSVTVDDEGVVYINRTDKGATQGAFTNHPFGDEWNQGYYEMELTVNNASRLKIGLLQLADLDRVGFNILPNVANADLTTGNADAYLHADAQNAATLWTSGANSFGTGIVEKSTAALASYIKTIVYDTYVADEANVPNPEFDATKPAGDDNPEFIKDGKPEDPRNVRDYGGNRANIKITYDCVDYIITLYEKVGGEWVATSAIDYSGAVEQGKLVGACLDFQAYNANTNATIKNIRTLKGMSASHLHTYKIGAIETDIFTQYDEEFLAELTEEYAEMYGLWNVELGWTNDGKTVLDAETLKAVYAELDETNYGPQTIKLAPIVKYEKATEAVLRGVQFTEVSESGKYDVRFVSAIGDTANVAAIGYDIVKTVSYGGYTKTTETSVETNKVCASLNLNYMPYSAEALGGKYAVAIGLEDEVALEGAVVTYTVTVYTIALDGTKTASNEAVTYSFYNGEYAPVLW